jgi:hypothetical protein
VVSVNSATTHGVRDRLALTAFVPQLVLLPQPCAGPRPEKAAPCARNGQLADASSTRDADPADRCIARA